MENNKTRKVIIMSLSGLLIGSLLYIFGLSMINQSVWPMIINYIIALLMYIASFLAVYNNNKIEKQSVYIYIMVLTIVLVAFATFATVYSII